MWCVVMFIPGDDPEVCLLRKTLLRNVNLMAVLVLRNISDSVRDRLKTLEDVVSAGKITQISKLTKEFSITQSVRLRIHDSGRVGML